MSRTTPQPEQSSPTITSAPTEPTERRGWTEEQGRTLQASLAKKTYVPRKPRKNFFSLPGELRNSVYRYALQDYDPARFRNTYWVSPFDGPPIQQPVLMRVSKQIRQEMIGLYYNHAFTLHIKLMETEALARWLQNVGAENFPYIQRIDVWFGNFRWKRVQQLLPLLIALRDLPVDPSKFGVDVGSVCALQDTEGELRNMLCLAVKAREQNLSDAALEVLVEEWVEENKPDHRGSRFKNNRATGDARASGKFGLRRKE